MNIKKMIRTFLIGSFVLTATFVDANVDAKGDDLLILVNKKNDINSISYKELENIYLGKKLFWSNGKKIIPIDFKRKTKESKIFFKDYLKINNSDFTNIWKEKLLSGQGSPPKSVATAKEVIQELNSNINAIGYIMESDLNKDDNVKKLTLEK